jgi:HTH-type transcriptional regulator/antitoxin HigA
MIANEQQYKATERAISELRESLNAFKELRLMETGIDPILVRAQRTSIQAAIQDLSEKIRQYDLARSGSDAAFAIEAVEDLGEQLISARIANGWTQRDLADRLSVKEQQIQRYEKEKYRMASLERLTAVARVLGVRLTGRLETVNVGARVRQNIGEYISSAPISCFPFNEMRKRGWLPSHSGKKANDDFKRGLVHEFFVQSGLRFVSPMLQSRTNRRVDDSVRCALLAWQARVKTIANDRPKLATGFTKVTTELVNGLVKLSADERGPLKAIEALHKHGIHVVFLPHLSKTLLDGGAMLLEDGTPAIGMTLRHDRLDNFWRVILHELGHIAQHWNCGLAEGFLDEEDDGGDDPREREADEFARNALIPDEVWKTSFVRYARTKEQVRDFANALGIGPAIVAGRLRFERDDFAALSDMVGRGTVRDMFRGAGLLED